MKPPALFVGARAFAVVLFTALALRAAGEDWFVKGRVYDNVRVLKVNPDTVSVTYDGGTGRLALADLPPDIAKRFAADAKKAQAFAVLVKQAETDPIAHLVVSLESINAMVWVNGAFEAVKLPPTASGADLVARLHYLKYKKVAESRQVQINDETYTAVRVDTADGGTIVIFKFEPNAGFWWERAFPTGY